MSDPVSILRKIRKIKYSMLWDIFLLAAIIFLLVISGMVWISHSEDNVSEVERRRSDLRAKIRHIDATIKLVDEMKLLDKRVEALEEGDD